jgi:hypothetical protein
MKVKPKNVYVFGKAALAALRYGRKYNVIPQSGDLQIMLSDLG